MIKSGAKNPSLRDEKGHQLPRPAYKTFVESVPTLRIHISKNVSNGFYRPFFPDYQALSISYLCQSITKYKDLNPSQVSYLIESPAGGWIGKIAIACCAFRTNEVLLFFFLTTNWNRKNTLGIIIKCHVIEICKLILIMFINNK